MMKKIVIIMKVRFSFVVENNIIMVIVDDSTDIIADDVVADMAMKMNLMIISIPIIPLLPLLRTTVMMTMTISMLQI